jgi:FMN phosphatase YigB (HAD superfamily)
MTQHAAWLIDLDGTLYRALPVKVAMGLQLCFANSWTRRVIRAFRHEHESLRASAENLSNQPFDQQMSQTAERLGCPVEQVRTVIDDWMFARPGRWLRRFRRDTLIAEIAAFKADGGRTALISDYPARTKLQALDVSGLFDVVVANGELDEPYRLKPAPDAFQLAARRLNVTPSDCLVIGDRADADGLAQLPQLD